MNDVMMLVKRFECIITENESQLFCRMVIGVPLVQEKLCLEKLKDLHAVEVVRK
jgi:hypothetical protein